MPKRSPHTVCTVEGCERPHKSRGFCNTHYERWRIGRSLDKPLQSQQPAPLDGLCTIEGCGREHLANGWCRLHYTRHRKHGDVEWQPTMRAAGNGTIKDGYLIIHDHDHPLSTKWGMLRVHRAALYDRIGPEKHPCHWCGMTVRWDRTWAVHMDGLVVDHLDGDRLNNDPSNLAPSCGPCNRDRGSGDDQLLHEPDVVDG